MAAGSSTVEEAPLTIPRPPRFWASPFGWSFGATASVAVISAAFLMASIVQDPAQPIITLKGVMASKSDFFEDKTVQELLLKHRIRVEVTERGSREVALEVINQQTEQYDFAFPSGQPAGDLIKNDRRQKGNTTRKPSCSPARSCSPAIESTRLPSPE